MRTAQVTPEELAKRIVRFKSLTPRSKADAAASDIPAEASQALAADVNYTYMAPELPHNSVITAHAAIRGGDAGDAISVSMAVCRPGNGPELHAHMHTVEAFFCLKGRFAVKWGDKGENEITLDPYDFVHVPPGVVRTFVNVGDEEGELLVIIQGDRNEFDDVSFTPEAGDRIVERFGPDVKAKMEANGRSFTAGLEE
jgi:mannose-6-phosphate isomerase-like protein (cupin superfamily)